MPEYNILDTINNPDDLKLIPEYQLKELSAELRKFFFRFANNSLSVPIR